MKNNENDNINFHGEYKFMENGEYKFFFFERQQTA